MNEQQTPWIHIHRAYEERLQIAIQAVDSLHNFHVEWISLKKITAAFLFQLVYIESYPGMVDRPV